MPEIRSIRLNNNQILRRTERFLAVSNNRRFPGGLKLNRVTVEGSGLTTRLGNFSVMWYGSIVPHAVIDKKLRANEIDQTLEIWFLAYLNINGALTSEEVEDTTESDSLPEPDYPQSPAGLGMITVTIVTEGAGPITGEAEITDVTEEV